MTQKTQMAKGRSGTRTMEVGTIGPHVEVLQRCAQVCGETLNYCVEQGGDHVEPDHILALVDCSEVCNFTANVAARDSELTAKLLEACAEACKRCEESCEEFEDDETMKACADACRECYEVCANA